MTSRLAAAAGSIALLRTATTALAVPSVSCCRVAGSRSLPAVIGRSHSFAFVATVAPKTANAAPFHSTALAMTTPSSEAAADLRPQRPLRYLSGGDGGRAFRGPIDISDLDATIAASEAKREEAFAASRKISMCLARRRFRLERGVEEGGGDQDGGDDELKELMDQVLQTGGGKEGEGADRAPREANLSHRVEEYVRLLAYEHFLDTGHLLPPSLVPLATDEEYLGGACIGMARDLERYGVGRATVRDASSVKLARTLAGDVMDQLLEFDFRNGPLRRKYDGTKYALKTLETVLYELSVTGTAAEEGAKDDGSEPDLKKMKVDSSLTEEGGDAMDEDKKEGDGVDADDKDASPPKEERIPTAEIEALRKRMEHRDELRERLIKRCRDGQKAAKQAIYALHRGDVGRARKLMGQCEECVTNDLLPIVEEEPRLRYGSFANVMEEYAEARLFYVWLVGDDDKEGDAEKVIKVDEPAGIVLQPDAFPLRLDPAEYLGGLCDLTGEVGRFAVQRGTARDADGVRLCLETNMSVLHSLETLNRFPSGSDIGKKMGALRQSVQKLERMLYEMSLVEATGGKRNVAVESGHVHRDGDKED